MARTDAERSGGGATRAVRRIHRSSVIGDLLTVPAATSKTGDPIPSSWVARQCPTSDYHAPRTERGGSCMGERVILVCDVCGRPAVESATMKVGPQNWTKDLCQVHLDELTAGARKP